MEVIVYTSKPAMNKVTALEERKLLGEETCSLEEVETGAREAERGSVIEQENCVSLKIKRIKNTKLLGLMSYSMLVPQFSNDGEVKTMLAVLGNIPSGYTVVISQGQFTKCKNQFSESLISANQSKQTEMNSLKMQYIIEETYYVWIKSCFFF